jgi:hypothetical protein
MFKEHVILADVCDTNVSKKKKKKKIQKKSREKK